MADIRIKDLATTATTTASGDFMAVDGTTNGTRKLSATAPAFLTSVTTPSLTSPASTNLTLGTGTSGAAITVLSASNNVGIGTTTPNKKLEVFKDLATNTLGSGEVLRMIGDDGNTAGRVTELGFGTGPTGATFAPALIGAVNISVTGFGSKDIYFATRSSISDVAPTERMRIASTGTVSIASSTAGSSGAGALVVAGGLSAAGASYFGGALTGADSIRSKYGTLASPGIQVGDENAGMFVSGGYLKFKGGTSGGIVFRNAADTSDVFYVLNNGNMNITGAATFAGAVSYVGSLKEGSDNVISSSGTALLFGNSGTWTETRIGSTNASGIVTLYAGNAERMRIASTGAITMNAYGAGAATFDSSGNITSVSDARLKNITGTFTKGLAEIVKLTPKLYTWKPESGLVTDDINATLIAQDLIAAGLPEAVSTYRTVPVMEDDAQSAEDIAAGKPVTQHAKLDADGKAVTQRVDANYSVSDRTVIAALVNAVKELKAEIDALKAK